MSKPAHRELLVLRHAKSDWDAGAASDFDRPLNKRGHKDAPRMGRWIKCEGLVPDRVVSSPAERARLTTLAVAEQAGIPEGRIRWENQVYLADVPTLLRVLNACPHGARRILLVGHNPGLEGLVSYLADPATLPHEDFGFLKTATLARLAMPDDWRGLTRGAGRLLTLMGPKGLPETD